MPPPVGSNEVVEDKQIDVGPVILIEGTLSISIGMDASELQPLDESVNVKVADPPETPVTTPALEMVATAELELIQEPPLEGLSVVVLPAQIVS